MKPETFEEAMERYHAETCDRIELCLDDVHDAINKVNAAHLRALEQARAEMWTAAGCRLVTATLHGETMADVARDFEQRARGESGKGEA